MSAEAAGLNQRKRKPNFAPETHIKRWRPDEVESPTIKMHGQPSLLEEARPSKLTSSTGQSGGHYSGMMETDSNTVDENDEADSEDHSSESELSSDTETSSDSNSSSSDSDDEGDDDDDDEHVSSIDDATSDQDSLVDSNTISLPTKSKTAISNSTSMSDFSDLRLRITTFLPQLREANEDLMNAEHDHRIDAVADDQDHYIEMDLGLGVLKEKPKRRRPSREIQTRESSSSSSSSSSSVTTTSESDSETEEPGEDVMRDLLGEEKKRRLGRPVIQPLDET